MDQTSATASPNWTSTTKLLIGLVLVGLAAFLISRFSNLIPPLLMIFIIVYLLHPVISAIARGLGISWKLSVNLLFLIILASLLGLLTWGGVGLVGQVQSLITSVQDIVANLPTYVEWLSAQAFNIGPFTLDMRTLDLNAISQQLLGYVQPLLAQTGTLVGALAGGAAEVFGWTTFVLIVSYFILIESSGLRGELFKVELPAYKEDFERLGRELSRIWNAFLRGQIIIFALATGIYSILLPILGVRYALGIALMAGLAKFLPYIGPAITWVVMALVTLIQDNPFDLKRWVYAAIIVGTTLVIDQIIDTFIAPRIMASALKVHPAAVLVNALIFANLMGVIGVVIAAPLLATFLLLGRYVTRKMFDLEPWPSTKERPIPPIGAGWLKRIRKILSPLFSRRKAPENVDAKRPASAQNDPVNAAPQSLENDAEKPRKPARKMTKPAKRSRNKPYSQEENDNG